MLGMISIRSWDMLGGGMEAAREICTVIGAKNAKSRSWWRPFQVECFQNRHLKPDHFVSGHLSSVDVHSDQVFMELFDSWGMDELLSRYRRAYANCFQDTAGHTFGQILSAELTANGCFNGEPSNRDQLNSGTNKLEWIIVMFQYVWSTMFSHCYFPKGPGAAGTLKSP